MVITFLKRQLSRELIVQLFIFGVVGVTATLTHYFVALGTHEGLGVDLYIANLFGYVSAVLVSYFGHGKLTFKQELSWKVFMRFALVSVLIFLLSEVILYCLGTFAKLPHRVSLGVVVCIIPLISFVLSKLWVFKAEPVEALR